MYRYGRRTICSESLLFAYGYPPVPQPQRLIQTSYSVSVPAEECLFHLFFLVGRTNERHGRDINIRGSRGKNSLFDSIVSKIIVAA